MRGSVGCDPVGVALMPRGLSEVLAGFFRMTLPKERLVIQSQRQLTGELSLGAPVVGLSLCVPSITLADQHMRRLMGRVYRIKYEPINTAQVLGVLKDNDVHHGSIVTSIGTQSALNPPTKFWRPAPHRMGSDEWLYLGSDLRRWE